MNFGPISGAHSLDPSYSLPLDEPFTTRMALREGVPTRTLTALVRQGVLLRPVKGVYVAAAVPDTPRFRADCLRLVVPEDCVVVDRHAGWLLGAQMILAPNEHLAARPLSLYRPAGRGRLRNDFTSSGERNLKPRDIVEVDGIRVTTPIRTAWDLGRVRFAAEAICGMIAMLRLGVFTKEEVLAGIERFRGMRWVTTLRGVAPLIDPRPESPPECVLVLRCHEANLAMVPQVEVRRDGIVWARLDLGNERLRAGIEYDGVEWHSSPAQLQHDRDRRDELREDGWLIEVFTKQDVFGQHTTIDDRLHALRRHAEARLRRTG